MKEIPYWTWFIVAGLTIFVFGGLHMIVMHAPSLGVFNPNGGASTDWANVASRSQNQFIAFTYVILLAAALYHGLYGLRTIIFELGPGKSFQNAFTIVLWVAGLALFGIGVYSNLAAKSVARVL